MGYRFDPDDVAYLASGSGEEALAVAGSLSLTDSSLLADLSRLRRVAGLRAGAVAETVRLRRRAVAKLGPGDWLLTDEALQQAPPAAVARHRAARLAGTGVHDLTCSVGVDLGALARGSAPVVGSDIDPVRLAMARHNLPGIPLLRADALSRTTRGLLGYADPARRDATGRRILSADTVPSLADLDAVHEARLPVLRVPPGIDYQALARPGEVEVVSMDGVVREAVLWPAEMTELAGAPGEVRRASVLSVAGLVEQVTSEDPDDAAVGAVGEWVVDPDPAVVRAHLVRHWACRHRLSLLDPHLAYLTGSEPPLGVRAFRVLDVAPYAERTVAGWARRDRIGTLEIKQRGTPIVPDELRRRLRPALAGSTSTAATLILARVGRGMTAFWCRAERVG